MSEKIFPVYNCNKEEEGSDTEYSNLTFIALIYGINILSIKLTNFQCSIIWFIKLNNSCFTYVNRKIHWGEDPSRPDTGALKVWMKSYAARNYAFNHALFHLSNFFY